MYVAIATLCLLCENVEIEQIVLSGMFRTFIK